MQTKLCPACGVIHPINLFGKDKRRKDGVYPRCKPCRRESDKRYREANKESISKYMREYYAENGDTQILKRKAYYEENRERIRSREYEKKYGLTRNQVAQKLDDQDFKCLICSGTLLGVAEAKVDHCHTTGKVRGLLCNTCNLGLGLFKDSEENLANAIQYLAASRAE